MRYHFKVHRASEGGYWAECIELEGCITQGNDMAELRENMADALQIYVSETSDEARLAPLPKSRIATGRSVVAVSLDPKVAFGLLLRCERHRAKKTQAEAKELLGFKSLYSYQRLENAANPTLETITRVVQGFPKFPVARIFR